jgi:multidrug efflux pump
VQITDFFLKRPVFAIILNALIVIVGLMSLKQMSLREFPKIDIPILSIQVIYPNASPELIESTVTTVMEDCLAELEGLDTMTSMIESGLTTTTLKMQPGTSMDRTLILVREALARCRSDLPHEVKEPLVMREKAESGYFGFMMVSFASESMDPQELTHFANLIIKNPLRTVEGVSSVQNWGQPYTMSISLDNKKLYAFGVNVNEVMEALEKNNVSLPAGKFRENTPVSLDLRFSTPEEFEQLLLKENDGKPVFLKDVADVKLIGDQRTHRLRINGQNGVFLVVQKASDGNPLEISKGIREKVQLLKAQIPSETSLSISYDQADFIRGSLKNIEISVAEAVGLVLLIVFLFLRSIRAALIPLITIPISLIGGMILLNLCGYSINTITLLAMVLAVGLVVDDAIVVLENIHRHIEGGMSPLKAAQKGAREIGFAILAMTLTLASVYAPLAFMEGTVGKLFIEFAVALAGSVLISGVVALTLSPLMCSSLLNNEENWFPKIDHYLNQLADAYKTVLSRIITQFKMILGCGAILVTICALLILFLPHQMTPIEDRGLIGVSVSPLPGKDINALDAVARKAEAIAKDVPEGKHYFTFIGYYGASIVMPLRKWAKRSRSAQEIVEDLFDKVSSFPSVDMYPWSWQNSLPGVDAFEESNVIVMALRTVDNYQNLATLMNNLREKFELTEDFQDVSSDLKVDTMTYKLNADRVYMTESNITPHQVAKAVEIFFSGNQDHFHFEKEGIRYPVRFQGNMSPWSLSELYITTPENQRVSLASFLKLDMKVMPQTLKHYNQMRSGQINLTLKPGQTVAEGIRLAGHTIKGELPDNVTMEWTGIAKAYLETSIQMWWLFVMALIFIYAIMAIQFESFLDPFIIILTVPLGCTGALIGLMVFGQSLNIYTQIGLVTLIGLITKHGIMMVEFANQLNRSGKPVISSIIEAAQLRLRPILMTTAAMMLGAFPLAFSIGAGAESRRAIGIVIICGLGIGTVLTLLMVPSFYWLFKTLATPKKRTT